MSDLNETHPQLDGRLPAETTCAFTIGEISEDYEMRASFLNLSAIIGVDISSGAFQYLDIVGCTFLGFCFEHCSSYPMWIRRSDGYVRITPPP